MSTPPEGQPPSGPDETAGGRPSDGTGPDPYTAPPAGPYGGPADPYAAPPAGPYGAGPAEPYGVPPAPPAGPYGAASATPYGSPPAAGGAQTYGPGPGAGPDGPPLDVVSVLGLVLAFLLAPVGLVLSIVGLFRTAGKRRRGRGLAVAGVIVSVVVSLVIAALIAALVAFGSLFASEMERIAENPGVVGEDPFDDGFGDPVPVPSDEALPEPGDLPSELPAPPTAEPDGELQLPAPLALGEAAEVGSLVLTITAVDLEADDAVAAADPANPVPEGRYVVATGTVENPSAEPQPLYLGLDLGYATATGEAFGELSCDATLPGQASDFDLLEPGVSAEVVWCFDVPADLVGDGTVFASSTLDFSGESTVSWSDR